MASEAEILAPVCETRAEQVVDQATNISISKHPQEEQTRAVTHNGLPTVEVENFLTTSSIAEVHYEVNNNSPDVSQVNKVALSEETLEVTNLPSEEIKESKIPCIVEGEDLKVQVKTTEDESGVGKTTDKDISCNLTSDVSKEGECEQNKTTSEQEGLGNERNFADNLDTAAEKASQENSTITETITHETSTSDESQSKNDLNASFCKEEQDISIEKDDRSATTPEDPGILSENTLNMSHGDVEFQSKTLEDTASNHTDPNLTEKSQESSFIQVDRSQTERDEQLEEESEKLHLTEVSTGGTNNSKSAAIDEVKDEDEDLRKAELFETEHNTSTLMKEDVQIENPAESLHVAPEKIEASNLGQESNTISSPKEQITNANLHENTGGNTEEKPIDAAHMQTEIPESFSTIVSSSMEEGSVNSVLQEVTSDCKDEKVIYEVDAESALLKKENLQDAPEDHEASASSEDIETTCSLEEQNLVANPQAIMSDKTIEAAETKEVTLDVQNVATEIPHERTEENSVTQVDCSQIEHEKHLEKENEITPFTEAPVEETNADNSKSIDEHQNKGSDSIKAESENEENKESTSAKEETEVEKPIDSLEAAYKDIKAFDSGQDTSIEEQIPIADSQEISKDTIERQYIDAADTNKEGLQDIVTNIPNGDNEDSSPIEEHGSQKPSLEEASTRYNNDEKSRIMHESKLMGENEKYTECTLVKEEVPIESLQVAAQDIIDDNREEKTNDTTCVDEGTPKDMQNIAKTAQYEDIEENLLHQNDSEDTSLTEAPIGDTTESTLVKEEAQEEKPSNSLQVASEDIKALDSNQETSSVEEQSLAANPQTIMSDKSIDAAETKEVTLDVQQNVTTEIPHEHTEENSVTQVDCSQIEHKEHLEKENEISPLTKAPVEETNANESKSIYEHQNRGIDSIKAELEHEEDTKNTSVKEEAEVAKPIDSLQVAYEDIKASDSGLDTSTEEQIPAADSQEILEDKIEKESLNISDTNKESLQDIATNIPNGDNEDNSPIEEDAPKPSLEEASTDKSNDEESTITHESKLVGENEKKTECASVKEEVPIESLPVAAQNIKPSALGQDRETSLLEEQRPATNLQGIMDDNNEDKINDTTCVDEETPENTQNIAKTSRYEDIEENLPVQTDSENISLTEVPIGDTIESTSVKEEGQGEKPMDSLQAASEDIKAFDSNQETSTVEEQSSAANPQAIMSHKIIDAAETKEVTLDVQQNVTTEIPHEHTEENSVTQVDCSQIEHKEHLEKENEISPLTKAPVEETNANESKSIHEHQYRGTDSIKAELEHEEETENTSVKEEAEVEKPVDSLQAVYEDIKASDLGLDTSIAEQIPAADSQEISGDKIEEESIDVADTNKESLQDIATNIPNEDNEDNLPTEEDAPKPPLEEASTGKSNDEESTITHDSKLVGENKKNTECTSVKEEVCIESLQVAAKDIKPSTLCQDRETSLLEEQGLTTNPQGIMDDNKEEQTNDTTCVDKETPEDMQNIVKTTPYEDIEENLPLQNDCENTSLMGAPIRDTTESTLVKEETQGAKPSDSLQPASEDIKAYDSNLETSSVEEQSSAANPQAIMSEKTIDSVETKETLATEISHEHTEENSVTQVDCLQIEHKENLEKKNEISPLAEARVQETNVNESRSIHEHQNRGTDSIKTELEHEEDTENTSVKEEAEVEKPIDSLQAAYGDIKASDSSQDVFIEEQIPTVDSQEISRDKLEKESIDAADTNKESLQAIATNIPNEDTEDNLPIAEDAPEPSLEEVSTGKSNDEESTIMHESKLVGENEKNTECIPLKEEAPIESLQVAAQNIKPSALGQDRETSLLEEQSLTTNPQGIMGDNKEEKTNDTTCVGEENPEDMQNIEKTTPYEDIEENFPVHNDSENISLTEASTGDTIESTLVKEESHMEKLSDPLQVATKDIKAFDSYQEAISVEEQILTADLQEISCEKTEEETTDAAYSKKESLEEVARYVPNASNEANSPTEVDGLQKPSLEEASTGNTNDEESTIIHVPEFADKKIVKADLFDNGENIECALVKEEVSVKSLQVENEDIKAAASGQDREKSHLEEKGLTTNYEGIIGDHKEDKTIDVTDLKDETSEDTNFATTSDEDIKDNSLIQVDCSQLEQNEHSEKDSESTHLPEASTADTTESTLVKEEAEAEDRTDSLQVATEDAKAFAPCQDTESNSPQEQLLTVDPKDISSDKTIEKTSDATDREEILEVQDIAKGVLHGDNKDNSPIEEDGSQQPSPEEALTVNANESTTKHEAAFVDESLEKADLPESGKNKEKVLIKEDASLESLEVAAEVVKASSSIEDRETNSEEEQILSANPGVLMVDEKENKTIGPTDLQKETPKDEVPIEIEKTDIQVTTMKLKKEEGYLEIPCTIDLDVNKDVEGHIGEDPNCKQEESSITEVSEEHTISRNENVSDVTTLASEVSEVNNDQKVFGEANSCGHTTDAEKIKVLDKNETLAKTDPRESTEAHIQLPNQEKEAKSMQRDSEVETDQKDIEEELLINASQDVSESKGVNGEAEKINSNNCREISRSSNSVALEEVSSSNVADNDSTSNSLQESRRETGEEAENEEAQKQEEKLDVSALVQDSSTEKIGKEVQLCLASADDSDIMQEMQKLKEAPLPAPDESIIETTDRKESEVVEDATRNQYTEHLEQDDTTKSFLDDKKPTERDQEETECEKENVTLDEKVEIAKSMSIPAANDFIPTPSSETSKVDCSTTEKEVTTDREELQTGKTAVGDNEETEVDKYKDDEEEASEQKITDVSSAALNMIEARDKDAGALTPEAPEEDSNRKCTPEANNFSNTIDTAEGVLINESTSLEGVLVNNRSITYLEDKIDDESPAITETTPTATESHNVESTCVQDTSACIGSLIEEKSDSNEVAFAPEERQSGYESKIQGVESIDKDQTCDVISKTDETKTEEENLEAAAEIKSDEVVAEDISEKEITKDSISSEKVKEQDEDVKDYHRGSCEEEVTTDSHLEEEVKQEEEMKTKEVLEVIKDGNETENVSKASGEADDTALEEPKENLLANESIDRSIHEKEQAKCIEEVKNISDTAHGLETGNQDSNKERSSSTVAFPEEEDNRTGADDTDNEMAKDEGSLNLPVIDAAARELPKQLDEDIICQAPPANTIHTAIEDSEAKKENANTIMLQQQEENSIGKHKILPLPESPQGKEGDKQNQKDEIYSSDEVQAKDEETLLLSAGKGEDEANIADTWSKPNEDEDRETYVEAEKLAFSSHTKDIAEVAISDSAQDIPKGDENSTTENKSYEKEYPNKSTESQISTVSEDIALKAQASEATRITAEVQEAKAGIDLGAAVPEATGVESRQVDEVNDAETSTLVEPPAISTSTIIPECIVETSLEAEHQQTKLHDLPQELNIMDSKVKIEEKDDPMDLQNVRDISEDVQKLDKGSFEASEKEIPAEADPDKNIETTEGREMEAIQNAPMLKTVKQEPEEQKLGMAAENVSKPEINFEEEKIIKDKSSKSENSCGADTQKVSESNIDQSSVEDTAQNDKNQESRKQIDSLFILPQARCSDIETAEKDLPVHVAGLEGTDVTEVDVNPLPSTDKHIVLEADHAKNLNPENLNVHDNVTTECSQGEHEILEPSEVEQEEAGCGNEERTDKEIKETPESEETSKPLLSDLFEATMRERSKMADHSAIGKEPTTHREELHVEKTDDAEHEERKTDEEKDDEEECEQRRSELSSEVPVIVNMGDADVKVAHKKSHNILSGVGSKVKHSIAKVKKAITGKSSHPKPPSQKKVIN